MTDHKEFERNTMKGSYDLANIKCSYDSGLGYCTECLKARADAIAQALKDARNQGLEDAVEVAERWANSPSCDSHDYNPCCHVRTGEGIAKAIESLKTKEKR